MEPHEHPFDTLARSLGAPASRRAAFGALAGLALGSRAAAPVAAGRGGRCRRRKDCRGGKRCVGRTCVPSCDAVLDAAGCGFAQPDIRSCQPGTDLAGAVLARCDLGLALVGGTDFSGANLAGAQLDSANLSNAKLNLADLRGADLGGADLGGADLTGVRWGNTTCPDGTNSDGGGTPTCCGRLNGKTPAAGC